MYMKKYTHFKKMYMFINSEQKLLEEKNKDCKKYYKTVCYFPEMH